MGSLNGRWMMDHGLECSCWAQRSTSVYPCSTVVEAGSRAGITSIQGSSPNAFHSPLFSIAIEKLGSPFHFDQF